MDSENKNKIREKIEYEIGEDATEYGEFISSYFAWIPLEEQKRRANILENTTKNKE